MHARGIWMQRSRPEGKRRNEGRKKARGSCTIKFHFKIQKEHHPLFNFANILQTTTHRISFPLNPPIFQVRGLFSFSPNKSICQEKRIQKIQKNTSRRSFNVPSSSSRFPVTSSFFLPRANYQTTNREAKNRLNVHRNSNGPIGSPIADSWIRTEQSSCKSCCSHGSFSPVAVQLRIQPNTARASHAGGNESASGRVSLSV